MPKKSMLYYELYDLRAGGILDDFDNIKEAHKHLSEVVDDSGWNALDDLSLVMVLDGERSLIAKGAALAVHMYQWRLQRNTSATAVASRGSTTFHVSYLDV